MTLREQVRKFSVANSRIGGLYHKMVQQLELNLQENRILYAIYIDRLETQKQICDCYEMPKQTVNNIITALQKQGYLEINQSQQDRRQRILHLTESGKQYAEEQLRSMLHFEEQVAGRITTERYHLMVSVLEEYAQVMEQVLLEAGKTDTKQGDTDLK